jgi:transcriptional regulator with XRE-family HTH domain
MDTETAQSHFRQLGTQLLEKRVEAGLSIEKCARILGCEPNEYEAFEQGTAFPSLIQLEAISYLLGVLPETFWEYPLAVENESAHETQDINFALIARIRRRTIGLNLRRARMESGLSPGELAEKIGSSVDELNTYEMGVADIAVDKLALAVEFCGVSLNEFLDRKSPVGSWAESQRLDKSLAALPADLKAFISRPINQPYLELAKKLSEMPVQQLREIAEGLLEITL